VARFVREGRAGKLPETAVFWDGPQSLIERTRGRKAASNESYTSTARAAVLPAVGGRAKVLRQHRQAQSRGWSPASSSMVLASKAHAPPRSRARQRNIAVGGGVWGVFGGGCGGVLGGLRGDRRRPRAAVERLEQPAAVPPRFTLFRYSHCPSNASYLLPRYAHPRRRPGMCGFTTPPGRISPCGE